MSRAALILHHQRASHPARICLLLVQLFMASFQPRHFFWSSFVVGSKLYFNCAIFNDDRLGQVLIEDAVWYYWWHNQLTSYSATTRRAKCASSANEKHIINCQLLIKLSVNTGCIQSRGESVIAFFCSTVHNLIKLYSNLSFSFERRHDDD